MQVTLLFLSQLHHRKRFLQYVVSEVTSNYHTAETQITVKVNRLY